MNTLALLLLAMIIVPLVLLGLMLSVSAAQTAGSTLVLGVPGFVLLKHGKAGSPEHKPEDGAS